MVSCSVELFSGRASINEMLSGEGYVSAVYFPKATPVQLTSDILKKYSPPFMYSAIISVNFLLISALAKTEAQRVTSHHAARGLL